LHPGSAAEPYRRTVDNAPTGGVDLYCPPGLVAEIEIETIIQPADADVYGKLGRIKMCPGLDDVQCRLQSFRTRRASCRLVKAACQPPAETPAADRPSLTVATNVKISEAGTVRGVEEFGRFGKFDQQVSLGRPTATVFLAFVGD